MMETDQTRRRVARYLALVLILSTIPAALAHAVLLESTPAANAKVQGDSCQVRLKFNLRVDGKRSRVILVRPDRTTLTIQVDSQSSDSVLLGNLDHLAPGEYRIRWQVLAADGHISRGEVPFAVVAPAPQR